MDDLQEYLTPKSDVVYQANRVFFDSTRELLLFSGTIIDRLNQASIKPSDQTPAKRFVLYSFFRSISHGMVAWSLSSAGNRAEAAIIARSMAELFIKYRYFLRDDATQLEETAEEFFEYHKFLALKDTEKCIRIAKRIGEEQALSGIERDRAELSKAVAGRKKTSYWPGRHVSEIAKDAGCTPFYESCFGLYCRDTHFSPENLPEYYDGTKVRWCIRPTKERINELLVVVYEVCLATSQGVQDTFFVHPFWFLETAGDILDRMQVSCTRNVESPGGAPVPGVGYKFL